MKALEQLKKNKQLLLCPLSLFPKYYGNDPSIVDEEETGTSVWIKHLTWSYILKNIFKLAYIFLDTFKYLHSFEKTSQLEAWILLCGIFLQMVLKHLGHFSVLANINHG